MTTLDTTTVRRWKQYPEYRAAKLNWRQRVSPELMARVRAVYQSCAAARFGGAPAGGLGEGVREVIVALEDEACRVPHTS